MGYELRFTSSDLLRCRFAISPVWETAHVVRLLHHPRTPSANLPWLQAMRDRAVTLDYATLAALQPARGWTPDFLSPTPEGPETTIEDELARIRRTRTEDVVADLVRTQRDHPEPDARKLISRMLDDPAAALSLIADVIERCWHTLVAPDWPPLRDLLRADIAYHTTVLAEGGLEALFAEWRDRLSWQEDTLVVSPAPGWDRRQLDGTGLVLMPSAFVWPATVVLLEVEQPTIVYPARGAGEPRPARDIAALARLLGRTRALLLADLAEATSTTVLARRHGLSPSGVSAHLAVLKSARLVTSRRFRHEVLYQRTPLGAELAGEHQ